MRGMAVVLLSVVVALVSFPASAQITPVIERFLVNQYPEFNNMHADVAIDNTRVVFAWLSTTGDNDLTVRFFNHNGAPMGDDVPVWVNALRNQVRPVVALTSNGEAVVIAKMNDTHGSEIRGCIVGNGGTGCDPNTIPPEGFQVTNDVSPELEFWWAAYDVAASDSEIVTMWNNGAASRAQRFTQTGEPIGEPFFVYPPKSGATGYMSAAMASDSRFVVQTSSGTAALYDTGAVFRTTVSGPGHSDVSSGMADDGRFALSGHVGDDVGVNLFAEDGTPTGFIPDVIDQHPTDLPYADNSDMAMDGNGNFVVVYRNGEFYGGHDVYLRAFLEDGSPAGPSILVNPSSTNWHHDGGDDYHVISVDLSDNGVAAVVWMEDEDSDNHLEVYASLFDVDFTPYVALEADSFEVDENAGTIDVEVGRFGSPSSSVTVNFATAAGSAVAPGDFTAVTQVLSWGASDTGPKTVSIPITNDATGEDDETFSIALTGPTGGFVLGDPSNAVVTIVDDDRSYLEFSLAGYEVSEAATSIDLSVTRTGVLIEPAGVDFSAAAGSATAGVDYSVTSPQTLSWDAGNADIKTVTVTILPDSLLEGPETVHLSLSNPTGGGVLGTDVNVTLQINDDEHSDVRLSAGTFAVDEIDGMLTVTVHRTAQLDAPVSVDVVTTDITATGGFDYTIHGETLSWPAGDGTDRSATIEILPDALFESSETFTVALVNPMTGAVVTTPGSADVTITDTTSLAQFTTDALGISEDGVSLDLTVQRVGNPNGAASVFWSAAGVSATSGLDFVSDSGQLSWADGDTSDRMITVYVLEDELTDDGETFTVDLSSPSGNLFVGTPASVIVTISDNDWQEFPVNTYFTSLQTRPSVAMDSSSNMVAVWDSFGQDGSGWGVYGQRLDSLGGHLGAEFPVNTTTDGDQRDSAVAMAADGSFVVVWESWTGPDSEIFGQRFDAAGNPLGNEFQVNTVTGNQREDPELAVDGAGNFMVVWQAPFQDGSGDGVFGRVYTANGSPVGSETQVNVYATDDQNSVAVTGAGSSGFVVVWDSWAQFSAGIDLVARRFAATGSPLSGDILINQITSGNQEAADVAAWPDGSFMVVWQDLHNLDGDGKSVRGRKFSAAGVAASDEFEVNSYGVDDQANATVAISPGGMGIVAWESTGQDTSGLGVYYKLVGGNGQPVTGESRANLTTVAGQFSPDVAWTGNRLVAIWTSAIQDGSSDGIFGWSGFYDGMFLDGFESGDLSAWSVTNQ